MPAFIVFGPPLPEERQARVSPTGRQEFRLYVEEDASAVVDRLSSGTWPRCTVPETAAFNNTVWVNPAAVVWVEEVDSGEGA